MSSSCQRVGCLSEARRTDGPHLAVMRQRCVHASQGNLLRAGRAATACAQGRSTDPRDGAVVADPRSRVHALPAVAHPVRPRAVAPVGLDGQVPLSPSPRPARGQRAASAGLAQHAIRRSGRDDRGRDGQVHRSAVVGHQGDGPAGCVRLDPGRAPGAVGAGGRRDRVPDRTVASASVGTQHVTGADELAELCYERGLAHAELRDDAGAIDPPRHVPP